MSIEIIFCVTAFIIMSVLLYGLNKIVKQLVRPFVNRIYQDLAELEALQSRSCEGCKYLDKGKYGICPIAEPLMRQWLNYDEDTFCCNRYIPKEQ